VNKRVAGSLLALALFVSSCGGSSADSPIIEGQYVSVKMYDNRFEYTEVRIPTGGSVTWLGAGRNPHNSSDTGDRWSTESVFGSLDQFQGDLATISYDTPGKYTFFCSYHGNKDGKGMSGTLIVGSA